jgi:hypothetical protein
MSKNLERVVLAYNKGYRVINGEVWYKGKKRKLVAYKNGYIKFSLRNEIKQLSTIGVHKLVAYQKFKDELLKEGVVIRHLDSNPLNNLDNNIAIGSHSDNMQDIPKEIRVAKAVYASSFMKQFNHIDVTSFYNNCKSYKKTMINFGIKSKSTLHFILKRNN